MSSLAFLNTLLFMVDSTEPVFEPYKLGWSLLAAFWSIAIVNLACALDATTISTALPASFALQFQILGHK